MPTQMATTTKAVAVLPMETNGTTLPFEGPYHICDEVPISFDRAFACDPGHLQPMAYPPDAGLRYDPIWLGIAVVNPAQACSWPLRESSPGFLIRK